MADLDSVNVHLVEDLDSAHAFLTWLGKRRPVLAIDTETTGLEYWTPQFLRMVQFGDGATGWSVPIRNWRGVAEEALRYVREDKHETVFHNVTFDLHALESDDLPTPDLHHVHDTATMHRLLEPLAYHSLKGICGAEFGPEAVAGQNLLKKDMSENGWTWATVPDDRPSYWAYAALDTVLTALLAERLSPRLRTAGLDEPYEREMAVQLIMYRAECRGMKIDPDYTRRLKQTWETEAEGLRVQLRNAGVERPGSNKAVNEALKAAGWEPDEFTDTGQPRLDKAILNHLLTTPYANVAEPLLRFRRIKKWTSTYLDTFLTKRDGNDRVHASINTMGARTGRMSITKPGLQTLPRGSEIRTCVVPFEDDQRLASIDYDTMEMRLFADYSGDPGLIGAINAGEDMHTFCAATAYGVPTSQVTPEQRQIAKNCVAVGTPVLRADGVWVPAEQLNVGDELYGFDEARPAGTGRERMRRWRPTTVTDTGIARRASVCIHLEDGSQVTSTCDHPWIATSWRKSMGRTHRDWATAGDLQAGDYLHRALTPWWENQTRQAGWLAGFLDGEGHGSVKGWGGSQNAGPVWDKVVREFAAFGVPIREHDRGRINTFMAQGSFADRMYHLGRIGSVRLLKNTYATLDGFGLQTTAVKIVKVEPVMADVVLMGTTTKTYIANGFCAHNTNFARIYGAGPAKIALTAGVSEGEIKEYLRLFDERFPGANAFIRQVDQVAKERAVNGGQAYITTLGGRRLLADNDKIYTLVNAAIQGGTADIFKQKIIALDAAGLADHIVVPVHDELIFSFPAKGFDEYARLALDTMEEHEQLSVPMTCGLDGPLERWGDKGR